MKTALSKIKPLGRTGGLGNGGSEATVRATEKLAQSFLADDPQESGEEKKAPATREVDIHVRALSSRFREHLATHVAIHHSSKKGKIEIEYYGDDDLQRLIELLGLPKGD